MVKAQHITNAPVLYTRTKLCNELEIISKLRLNIFLIVQHCLELSDNCVYLMSHSGLWVSMHVIMA